MNRRQRGIAAITALLVVAIATILAVQLAWETSLDVRRTETMLLTDQAREYALGVESLGVSLLQTQFRNQTKITAQDLEDFQHQCAYEIEGGTLACRVEDLQGRFDLNNLVDSRGRKDPLMVKQFQRLLEALDLDPALADAVTDWIDPDTVPEVAGAEDDYYSSKNPPYRAANFWFVTPTELLAVKGFDDPEHPEFFQRLAGCVTALPAVGQPAKLNVNTMKVPVFLSLGPDVRQGFPDLEVSREAAQDCDAVFSPKNTRAGSPDFSSTAEFQGRVDPAMMPYLGVDSGYFALYVTVSIGTVRLNMYSLIERSGQTATVRIRHFDAT